MQSCGQTHVDAVVSLAEQVLTLNEIAIGPSSELGLGKKYEAHSSLGFVVQELSCFPGIGYRLIEVALKSPVIPNRNTALRTLAKWGRAEWPENTLTALSVAFVNQMKR